ncbi:MAG: N(5)-(carboxyethyl)ornithine synthase [Erysipelotrichaceae bacterium]|nr:N(5)-(carboxyethyl)ornithine synthase [Erysipelotrichaceae bacterium]
MAEHRIGFLISQKPGEKRRALMPEDLQYIEKPQQLYFEEGYGDSVLRKDNDYRAMGANIVSRDKVYECDVLVDVKLGDNDEIDRAKDGAMLVGWAHAVQKTDFTTACIRKGLTVLAWEEIFDEGRYIFYRNREIAGEMGVLQALAYVGRVPYDLTAAVIGNGQTAKGAIRILNGLGTRVDVYARKHEKLFKKKMYDYDLIINCVMWDTSREDHLVSKEDLKKLKPGAAIIDISCDPHMAIETSHPTRIDDPVYYEEGVLHYAVDNTPAMVPLTVSEVLSKNFASYYNDLINGELPEILKKAIVIDQGRLVDQRIIDYRTRLGLPLSKKEL